MLHLEIITPLKQEAFDVQWLEVITSRGSLVIQEGHAPLLARLADNSSCMFLNNNQEREVRLIKNGLMRVTRQNVTLLVEL
jgi:F0F1-type ATP synthase epsilon subunit